MKSVISIGYGRQVFSSENRERERLLSCAKETKKLHLVVFSSVKHYLKPESTGGVLFLHPTNSKHRVGMLIDAYRIGRDILKKERNTEWIITTQDPFDAGLIGYALSRLFRVPLQVQEHGDFFGSPYWRTERFLNHIRYAFGRFVIRRADCIRVVSSRVKKHIVSQGVKRECISILPILTDVILDQDEVPVEFDLRKKFPNADAIFLFAGRLVQEKNLPLLVRSFKRVHQEFPTARLVIVGSGPEEVSLKRLIDRLGISSQVTHIPWTDNVSFFMKTADVFVLSSDREGWARVLPEAMAHGLPAVTTDVGCVGEVFIDARHGVVVPVRDEAAFAGAMKALLHDESRRVMYGKHALLDSGTHTESFSYAKEWYETLSHCV